MPPRSRTEFAALFRGLSAGERVRFVAALWAERDWETTRDGDVVIAERDGVRRRMRVASDGWVRRPSVADVDALVLTRDRARVREAAADAGVDYRTPDDLRDLLLYGLDREAATTLFADHFGRSLSVDDTEAQSRAAAFDLPAVTSLRALTLVALLIAAGVTVADSALLGHSSTASGIETLGTFTPDEAGAVGGETDSPTPTPAPPPSGYPPGVSSAGVANASVLAETHLSTMLNHRYSLVLNFRGPAAAPTFDEWTAADWDITVEDTRAYHLEARFNASPDADPAWLHTSIYTNGVRDYRLYRSPDGTRKNLAPATASDATSYAYYGERLVATYLDTTDSRVACSVAVEDGCRIYNIVATGTPRALADQAPNATFADYRAEALVTTSGRVTDLTVTYRFVGETESGRVRLWVHYRDYGTARVERPDWLSVFETGTDSEEETETNSAS